MTEVVRQVAAVPGLPFAAGFLRAARLPPAERPSLFVRVVQTLQLRHRDNVVASQIRQSVDIDACRSRPIEYRKQIAGDRRGDSE